MPKKSKHPRFRTYIKRGKNGQVWVSYAFDNRGTGKPDVPLGTDREAALLQWERLVKNESLTKGTFEEAFENWERECLPAYDSEETRSGYAKSLKQIRPVFGKLCWHQIGMKELTNYLKNRKNEKTGAPAPTRANRELSLLSIVWHKALLWELTALPWPAKNMEKSRWKNKEGKRKVKVSNTAFDAVYKHGDQLLRDCMDLGSATGLRLTDCRLIPLDAEEDMLEIVSSKKGKDIEFDVLASKVLPALIARRKAMPGVGHDKLLALPNSDEPVTYAQLDHRWRKARAAAAQEAEDRGDLTLAKKIRAMWLRDTRKYAAQLAPDLATASKLLQHDDSRLTRAHYRSGEKVTPVR